MQTGRKSLLTSLGRGVSWAALALAITLGSSGFVRAGDSEESAVQEIIAAVISSVMRIDQTVAGIESAVGAFEESFQSKHIATRQLCISDESGAETCITKAELDAFLKTQREVHASADGVKSDEPAPAADEARALTPPLTAPTTIATVETAPADAAVPHGQAADDQLDATGSISRSEPSPTADAKYPDWQGGWERWYPPNSSYEPHSGLFTAGGQPSFDQSKPWGPGQEAPLTTEYQEVYENSRADQAAGGAGNFFDHAVRCMPGGMPLMTNAFTPLEFVVTPEVTYVLTDNTEPIRRIYTDGRDFPTDIVPTYAGYSIGRWTDQDAAGVYQVLEVETRGPFKGPRAYDATGLPLAFDNQSIFKERIYRDQADPKILHDEVIVIDNALTRPWIVDKKYTNNPHPHWTESGCIETNNMVAIGPQTYFMSADGLLMPVRKDQPAPDLRYFTTGSEDGLRRAAAR